MNEEQARTELVQLYQQMYELTEPECRLNCRCPHSCCSAEYCEMAQQVALEWWGVDVSGRRIDGGKLPFMGPQGCVLEPHLRPLCTMHTCDVNSLGGKMHPRPDAEWDEQYMMLRDRIEELTEYLPN